MADPNSPMPVARRAVDELIKFSGETEPSRYMNFFILQQISEGRHFLQRMHDEAQSSRSCLAQLNAMISELEAMNDARELFDSLMSLRDDKRLESEKLSLLNEIIAIVEEDIATKEAHVLAFMRSYRIEEELTLVKTFGKEVEEYVTKVIAKDGTVTRFEGRFPQFIEEEEEKKPKPYNLYGFVDLMENEQVYAKNGFAPHRILQPEGNQNRWLSEEE
ncbi:hypothetical protein Tco_0656242 [Tanacetum coccineum]|uniref:Uncharacterized protein n=1 Tax=Tanacetum coccineum TaxID=301880 RepID=A0ABQ4X8W3_9ASTR